MADTITIALLVLWCILALLFFPPVVILYVKWYRDSQRSKRQQQLSNCPPAEACPPPVFLPSVVDAAVVFPSDDIARNHIEEGNAPLTRLPSQVLMVDNGSDENHHSSDDYNHNLREPFAGDSSSVQGDGNLLPLTSTAERMMYGLPIDTNSYRMPNADPASCKINRPSGVMYQLRNGSMVYGRAEYIADQHQHTEEKECLAEQQEGQV
ncbi:hypothetical protein LSM04_004261 [Trypanosoma melophagium]|uniref:uncharacterized protein n=1 Tax=Trypanosoma melophagium TaxID=715481 RepID=UPI00351A98B1|nr:hypothetical protein LSM04_004261 [Trypanosoma melophagium]